MPLIEWDAFLARRFEIGEFTIAIAPFKRMFQQRRAVAIALFGRVHSNHRQIPMRLGRMGAIHLLDKGKDFFLVILWNCALKQRDQRVFVRMNVGREPE